MHLHARGIGTGASIAVGAEARHTQNEQQQNNVTAPYNNHTEAARHMMKMSERKLRCNKTANTQLRQKMESLYTCVTFIGVKIHRRRALWAGTGVSTRPDKAEMTAYILTRVGH